MDQQRLRVIFDQVDQDRSGSITDTELQNALANGNGTPFKIECVRLMMNMFDRDGNGKMDYNEFCQLFAYVQQWQTCFARYDADNSRHIDSKEFTDAIRSFGYNFSPQFIQLLIRRFDRTRQGRIYFDDFIHSCVCLQILTAQFRPLDTMRNGTATMSFEQFLSAALTACV